MKGVRIIPSACRACLWILLFLSCLALPAAAQIGSNPKQEFRAAWIATVANLDWPTQGAPAAQQQTDLTRLFDRLKAAGVNAVLFQVRNEADALYASSYEPWSVFLTGTQGRNPGYDPLAFAIEEAHKRGMELHAWFNPYRVWVSSRNYPRDPSSIYLTKPEWLLTINNAVTILNPGIPAVRAYLVQIIRDVAERYDVDGIHFDDYFYPYPPNQVTTQDQATYNEFGTAFGSQPTFRAYSVNMLVKGVRDMLAVVRPDVKWGISPFGIWKSGTPAGINGLSGATDLYADAVTWMEQQWLDYLTPQLYWAFGGRPGLRKARSVVGHPDERPAPLPGVGRVSFRPHHVLGHALFGQRDTQPGETQSADRQRPWPGVLSRVEPEPVHVEGACRYPGDWPFPPPGAHADHDMEEFGSSRSPCRFRRVLDRSRPIYADLGSLGRGGRRAHPVLRRVPGQCGHRARLGHRYG